jgi:hypothetical protein
MSDTTARCVECREPVDPRADTATVELNPNGSGAAGFHVGVLCVDCEEDLAEKMKRTTGGNV